VDARAACRVRRPAVDGGEQFGDVPVVERFERDAHHLVAPAELREQLVMGVTAGSQRADQQHRGVRQVAHQIGEQLAGGFVGPVQVLHDQDDRPRLGDPADQRQHLFEEPGAAVPGGRRAQAGQPVAERRSTRRQQPHHVLAAELAYQIADDRDEGNEWRALRSQFQTAADQRQRRARKPRGGVRDEPGLADGRLTGDQHGGGPARPGALVGRPHGRALGRTADQNRADDRRRHRHLQFRARCHQV
jgi:hypothetical protein